MVSLDKTAKKYRGHYAVNYESKRGKQIRWKRENEIVNAMLAALPKKSKVLDVPVGTGRYLELYQSLKMPWTGIDISEDMLVLARAKKIPGSLIQEDAAHMMFANQSFDVAVCVRFLDLIDEKAMQQVIKEICRVTRHVIICTIRLGPKYIAKVNTATHDEKKFRVLLRRVGWHIVQPEPIFKQGWHVLKLAKMVAANPHAT